MGGWKVTKAGLGCRTTKAREFAIFVVLFGSEYNFYAAYSRACVFRAMRNSASPHLRVDFALYARVDEDSGDGEDARVCVFRRNREFI